MPVIKNVEDTMGTADEVKEKINDVHVLSVHFA